LEQWCSVPAALDRRRLGQLAEANQRALIQHWLRHQGPGELAATALETLLAALPPEQGPGQMTLTAGHPPSQRHSITAYGIPQLSAALRAD
jgi:hypothetical protein